MYYNNCNNCGKRGHMYKDCKLPIISCGNIIYRNDNKKDKVLMIQRKDSLCYIDFIRGKYDNKNINYIQILIDKCSKTEKENILKKNYSELWKDLWLLPDDFETTDDYLRCMIKFNKIKEGFIINEKFINIEMIINNSKFNYEDSEWEFPKGRRNMNENDFECAKREFKEETNYDKDDYGIIKNITPFNEEFVGENNIRYRYIYFIGKLKNYNKLLEIDTDNNNQISEIKDIRWLTKEEALDKCRDYHNSRKNLIEKVFNLIDLLSSDKYSLIY